MIKLFKPGEVWAPQLVVENQYMRDSSLTNATNYTADELRDIMSNLSGPDIVLDTEESEAETESSCAVSDLL